MPGTELRGPTAHTRIGPQRGQLRTPRPDFQQAAADVTADPDTWIARGRGRPVRSGRRLARARRVHRGPRRPVRGTARRLGRGRARGRPPATRPRGAGRGDGPGPGVPRLADRRTRRHEAPAVVDRHRQAGRSAPAARRRPPLPGVQRRRLGAATEHRAEQPGLRPGHRPNCRGAGLPMLLVRRHVRLHADERHPGRRRGAGRCWPSSGRSCAGSRPTTASGWGNGSATAACSWAPRSGRWSRPSSTSPSGWRTPASSCPSGSGSPPARSSCSRATTYRHVDQPRVAAVRRRRARRDPRQRRGDRRARRQLPGVPARRAADPRHHHPVSVWRVASSPEVDDDLPLSFAE